MQANEFESYSSYLDETFSKIVQTFNKLQLADYSSNTIKKGHELLRQGSTLLEMMKYHTKNIEKLIEDCTEFTEEVEEDMTCIPKKTDYIFHTKNGMLGYPNKEFITKLFSGEKKPTNPETLPAPVPINTPPPQPSNTTQQQKERILIPEIGYYLRINQVTDLSAIPPALYYYKSQPDKSQPSGIYMRLPNNNLVRVPFPEVVDSKKEYDRKHSIRCKYQSKDECDTQRQKMAKMYSSPVRVCNFAHNGDRLVKIGYPARCPAIPNFGHPQTMSQDIRYISLDDTKNMLLYGLSDILAAAIWFDYSNVSSMECVNLDVC